MTSDQGVMGIFTYIDSAKKAIRGLKGEGYKVRFFSPFPNHEIEDELKESESPVRFFTLSGATLGALCGFAFTVFTSEAWPIMVSAKPIASIPPYMIIVFELAVLFGGLSTLLGLLINARLRKNAPIGMYDPRFSDDKFGVMVVCSKENMGKVEEILKSSGADEIQYEGI